jgi:hypothetical protein
MKSGCNIADKKILEVDRLTVVILEQTEWRNKVSPNQLNVMSSQIWRDYVSKQSGQWRVMDPEADISKDLPWVRDAVHRKRNGLPWMIVQKENLWYSGPVPSNMDEMMEIIKQ